MQSPVEKEMAAVYVTTIPCERYTTHKVQGKPYFVIFAPVLLFLQKAVLLQNYYPTLSWLRVLRAFMNLIAMPAGP